ncbi:MAG: UvrB/UvrC motif-containing protein [Elusimicrobiota bacterium]
MLCGVCHKNEATIHFKGIFNGQVFKMDMCEECAIKKGVEEKKSITCGSCGITYADFKSKGRLGCANCYTSFAPFLNQLIEHIHGSGKHIETRPFDNPTGTATLKQKLHALTQELKLCISREEYEKAAEIRDKIKYVKGQVQKYKRGMVKTT